MNIAINNFPARQWEYRAEVGQRSQRRNNSGSDSLWSRSGQEPEIWGGGRWAAPEMRGGKEAGPNHYGWTGCLPLQCAFQSPGALAKNAGSDSIDLDSVLGWDLSYAFLTRSQATLLEHRPPFQYQVFSWPPRGFLVILDGFYWEACH